MSGPALDNRTPFAVLPIVLLDRDGEKLVAIVKATFELGPDGRLEPAPKKRRRPVRGADDPWGDPERSSVKYPGDLCVRKPATDVVVVARAFAPGGRPAAQIEAGVRVGKLERRLRVLGPRVWLERGEGVSGPGRITELDLRYEHAFGGCDGTDPARLVEEPRNPVGLGVARDLQALTGQSAPSIEDAREPITSAAARPAPAGVGAIGRHWEPRRRYLGSYDARWLAERAPLPPLDQDDRCQLCASPGLSGSPPLLGTEPVALLNLEPGGGTTRFALPGRGADIELRLSGREVERHAPALDTVLIDALPPGPITVELVWRAAVRAPRCLKEARIRVRETEAGR
ncbi:MAG: DUF2169 domain-containing protein [Deltaproteobacteria bacterium]|nr:DUF2169 domain-containing protein [Deltaproteobacteria bacterium]